MQKNVLSIKSKTFPSLCGVDLDKSGKNGSTSIKNELNEYLWYVLVNFRIWVWVNFGLQIVANLEY